MAISQQLKRFRAARHLAQKDVAAVLGMKQPSYAQYEQRERPSTPSADSVIKIALAFGVSTDYLLGLTDDPTPHWSVDAAPVKKSPADEAAAEMTTAPEMTPADIAGRIERIERALKDAGITF